MSKLNEYISEFILEQQLPASYAALVNDWFISLTANISVHQKSASNCLVLGINGAQGSGKSTLAALLVHLTKKLYHLNAISISLDDFYFTLEERQQLSEKIHPLLATRGVPGTHDINFAISTIKSLTNNHLPVSIPRFNKAIDDRYSKKEFDDIEEKVDLIILEGWCMGSPAQPVELLKQPINDLEKFEDSDGRWRTYVNDQLITVYPSLFKLVNCWVMLRAPSFECVYNWRLQQEQHLTHRLTENQQQNRLMDDQAVRKFIKYYQRITEYTLTQLPASVNYLYQMDEHRNIINSVINHSANLPVFRRDNGKQ